MTAAIVAVFLCPVFTVHAPWAFWFGARASCLARCSSFDVGWNPLNVPPQVYIYGCVDATINITGKCKMVAIDGCKKTKVGTAHQCQSFCCLPRDSLSLASRRVYFASHAVSTRNQHCFVLPVLLSLSLSLSLSSVLFFRPSSSGHLQSINPAT